jgi:hypothetical protein
MIPFFVKAWKKFWTDEMAAARIFRGFLLWTGGMAVSVLAFPFDDVVTWTGREWAYRCAAAGALGFAGLISTGQKNQTPEQIRAELEALPPKVP